MYVFSGFKMAKAWCERPERIVTQLYRQPDLAWKKQWNGVVHDSKLKHVRLENVCIYKLLKTSKKIHFPH